MPGSEICSCIPSEIYLEIDSSESIHQLREISVRMLNMLNPAICSGKDTENIVRMISGFNDAISIRLIALLLKNEGISLPEGATYLVLGSEGRGEQTLRTDQDSAIIYNDTLPSASLALVELFAVRMVDALETIGVPRCPGNIMASSPEWCHSTTEWERLVDQWISAPTPENMLNFGMLQDLKPLHGNIELGMNLRNYIRRAVHKSTVFFPNMAGHVVRFPTPFTFFRRIRTEKNGDNKGLVDLKKAGIFAISAGASLLALESGHIGGTTLEKLAIIQDLGLITKRDHHIISEAFSHLTHLRLKLQLQVMATETTPTNYINPDKMTSSELSQFRQALKGVETFLWIFRKHYLLDQISI